MRHWKQHWSPTADLIFLKRLRLGDDPKNPYVLPGDPVTQAHREKLGMHRLRVWWEGRVVGLANWSPDSGREARPVEVSAPEAAPKKAPKKKKAKKKAKKAPSLVSSPQEAPPAVAPAQGQGSGTGEPSAQQVAEYDGLLADGFTEAEAREVAFAGEGR